MAPTNSDSEADRQLLCYVLDYLNKRGMHDTAENLRKELGVLNDLMITPNSTNKPNGSLYEWWSEFYNSLGFPHCSNIENLGNQLAEVTLAQANEGLYQAPQSGGPPNVPPPTTSLLQAPNCQQQCPEMKTRDQEAHVLQFQGNSRSFNNAMGPPEANEGHNLAPLHGLPPNQKIESMPKLDSKTSNFDKKEIEKDAGRHPNLDENKGQKRNECELASQVSLSPSQAPNDQQQCLDMKTQALDLEALVLQSIGGFSSKDEFVSCHISSNGKILASAGAGLDQKVFLYNLETSYLFTTSEGHSKLIADVRFKPDSTTFATASFDGTVKIWDANRPSKSLFHLTRRNNVQVMSVDFHPTVADILCSSDSNGVIAIWDVNQRVVLKHFKGGRSHVRFQPRLGRFLATVTPSPTYINIIDTQNWSIVDSLKGSHGDRINSICWDTNGSFLASVSYDFACVWSIAFGQIKCIHELPSKGKRFQSCIFHPLYPNVLVIGCRKSLEFWIPETGQRRTIPAHNGLITGLAGSTQYGLFASASADKHVELWK